MTGMNSKEVADRLKSIIDYVQECERRVAQNELMDLQGLDRHVIEICDAISKFPQKEASAMEAQMSVLIERLERLAQAMKEQQERVLTPVNKE